MTTTVTTTPSVYLRPTGHSTGGSPSNPIDILEETWQSPAGLMGFLTAVNHRTVGARYNVPYQTAGKIGLQFNRRFWEEDEQIYGGVTRTNVPIIGSIAYPSYGYHGRKGIVQGYYNTGLEAIEVSNLPIQERIELALNFGSRIHPQYREHFENGFSVAWHRVPYILGGWSTYTDRTREQYYPRVLEPDGRFYLVSEALSHLGGWLEGAVRAAWIQTEKLHQRVRAARGG